MCVYIHMCVYIYICMYVCIHIYIYIYVKHREGRVGNKVTLGYLEGTLVFLSQNGMSEEQVLSASHDTRTHPLKQ